MIDFVVLFNHQITPPSELNQHIGNENIKEKKIGSEASKAKQGFSDGNFKEV